jgi:transmembrane sensor
MFHPFVYYLYNMETLFRKYLNGTCTPEEFSEALDAFCAENTNVTMSAEILKLWNETLNAAIKNKENSQLLDKIHHRIALEESKTATRRFNLYKNLLRVAAVLILGLFGTTLLFYYQPQKQLYSEVVETVSTPYAARTNFKLPDGSEIWLNSGSTISFPKQFGKERNVELVGQAYFKVVKDGKHFVVKTNSGSVEVMGTSFDIKAYKDENFQTTLVEGSVKIRNNLNQVAMLKPGQQSTISPGSDLSINEVNTNLSTSWKEGKLIFVKEPFQNVAKELERWYNLKIELQGEKLKTLGYTGTIEMETLGELLELINTTTPINYNFNKNTRVLHISWKNNSTKN